MICAICPSDLPPSPPPALGSAGTKPGDSGRHPLLPRPPALRAPLRDLFCRPAPAPAGSRFPSERCPESAPHLEPSRAGQRSSGRTLHTSEPRLVPLEFPVTRRGWASGARTEAAAD